MIPVIRRIKIQDYPKSMKKVALAETSIHLVRGQTPPQQPPGLLAPELWDFFAKLGNMRRFEKRSYVFQADEKMQYVSLVVSGLVALIKNETILDIVEPGQSIAGALLPGSDSHSTYPITARCLNACEVLQIDLSKHRATLIESQSAQIFFARQMQQRMRFIQKSRGLQSDSTSARIAFFLLSKKHLFENGFLTRKTIAQACNTTTESVIRQLSTWEKSNVLKQFEKKTSVIDSTALENLCAFKNL